MSTEPITTSRMSLTTAQIASTLSRELGFSPQKAEETLSAFVSALARALESGEEVRLRRFGRFYLSAKPSGNQMTLAKMPACRHPSKRRCASSVPNG
jgi:nucleoid DNA-binding protein